MASVIKTLKDRIGNIIYPRTRTDAVSNAAGKNVDTLLAEKLFAVDELGTDPLLREADLLDGHPIMDFGIEPVATYTHSGNIEAIVSAVDIATGTFTSVNHGFTNGRRVGPVPNDNTSLTYPASAYPGGVLSHGQYYIINATANTFQLSLTSGGASITLTDNAAMDLTQWHFEFFAADITITNLPPMTKCKVVITGKRISMGYVVPNDIPNTSNWFKTGDTTPSWNTLIEPADMHSKLVVEIDYTSILTMRADGITYRSNTATANISKLQSRWSCNPSYKNGVITSLKLQNWAICNGCSTEIYKM